MRTRMLLQNGRLELVCETSRPRPPGPVYTGQNCKYCKYLDRAALISQGAAVCCLEDAIP
eukprot:5379933-Pyramimonas_sp.AAC.1